MSLYRAVGSSGILTAGSNPTSFTAFTISGYCKVVSNVTATRMVIAGMFNVDNVDTPVYLDWDTSDLGAMKMGSYAPPDADEVAFASRPAVGEWFHFYLRCSGTGVNQLEAGWARVTDAAYVTAASTMYTTGGLVPAFTRFGSYAFTDTNSDMQFAHLRAWNAKLTDAELALERWTNKAFRRAGLVFDAAADTGTTALAYVDQNGGSPFTGSSITISTDNPPLVDLYEDLAGDVDPGAYLNSSVTNANETQTATASLALAAVSTTTNANETQTATASLALAVASTTTNANDTNSAAATLSLTVGSTTTDANDTNTAAATLSLTVGSTTTDANDTSTAAIGLALVASSTTTDANDTNTATISAALAAASTTTDANDTNTAAIAAALVVSSTTTDANDTLVATASIGLLAVSTTIDANDTLSGAIGTALNAASTTTDANDSLAATASIALNVVSSVNDADDTLSATGVVLLVANSSTTDSNDVLDADLSTGSSLLSSTTQNAPDSTSASMTAALSIGSIVTEDPGSQLAEFDLAELAEVNSNVTEANDTLTGATVVRLLLGSLTQDLPDSQLATFVLSHDVGSVVSASASARPAVGVSASSRRGGPGAEVQVRQNLSVSVKSLPSQ